MYLMTYDKCSLRLISGVQSTIVEKYLTFIIILINSSQAKNMFHKIHNRKYYRLLIDRRRISVDVSLGF